MNTKGTIMVAALALLHSMKPTVLNIPSYMIIGPKGGSSELSKRKRQRMKGKAARLNRGKNRGITRRRERKRLRARLSVDLRRACNVR